jgi:hypothetical protein
VEQLRQWLQPRPVAHIALPALQPQAADYDALLSANPEVVHAC